MFKKILASVGIGGAKVETTIYNEQIFQGDALKGKIEMIAGSVEQEIQQITLNLMTKVKQKTENSYVRKNYVIDSFFVNHQFILKPNQVVEKSFEIKLHPETPITAFDKYTESKVWLETNLGINFAYDPSDKDYLEIQPGPIAKHIIDFMLNQDFKIKKADVESGYLRGKGFRSKSGFYQEIEFVPKGLGFFGVREIEISTIQTPQTTQLFLEIDKAFASDSYQSIIFKNKDSYQDVSHTLQQMFPSIFKKPF